MPLATTPSKSSPHALTLPRSSFAKTSPATYLAVHLRSSPPQRPNGRSPSQFRVPACTTGSLNHCAGSAVVRVGDTAVVCGIRAEILTLDSVPNLPKVGEKNITDDDAISALGLLVPNVELATGCSPAHVPGGAPSTGAQTLAQRLWTTLLNVKLVEPRDLQITRTNQTDDTASPEAVAFWVLYASIHVLSLSGSQSLFDVAWASLLAALHNVRLPRAWWDVDAEAILCSDKLNESHKLRLSGRPLACTWSIFSHTGGFDKVDTEHSKDLIKLKHPNAEFAWILADTDGFEEQLCDETITMVVDCSTGETIIKALDKSGGMALGRDELKRLSLAARQQWTAWDKILPK